MTRIPSLDGIRGFAILLVLVWHYVIAQMLPPSSSTGQILWGLGQATWSGVDLFFVLSGFLIGGILLDNRESPNLLRTFYVRRACRIFPLYYAWLLFVVSAPLWWFWDDPYHRFIFRPGLDVWPYFFYVQNLVGPMADGKLAVATGVTWSLAIEEQFYLIIPWIILLVPRRWVVGLMLCLILSAPVARHCTQGTQQLFWTPCRWDGPAMGVILAVGLRTPLVASWLTAHHRSLVMAILAAFAVGCVLPMIPGLSVGAFRNSVLILMYAGLLTIVVTQPLGKLARMFSWRGLGQLGRVSYGIYIFHFPILYALFQPQIGRKLEFYYDWALMLLCAVLSWALATVSFRFFESPIINWGHRSKYH